MDLLGRSINHYNVTQQLGEGGMAIVYKAFDTHLDRDVAIKVIRTEQFAPAILEKILKRFEREAKLVGKLSHPNIVNVIDYGEFEGSPYLVMPYLDGGTLKSYLGRRGVLPWQEAVRLLLPIAEALQYAHEHNVLHRDVKPSNILLTDAGQPMLTDFGVAKVLESDEGNTLTGTGIGLGTPEYMAPEQWQGQFSAQSDIYALGVVLYEMVTGVRPYTADTPAAVLIKQITGPLRRPRDIISDLPEKVEQALYKALAIKPEDRFEDMRSFVTSLRSLEKELPTVSTPEAASQGTISYKASNDDRQKTFVESYQTVQEQPMPPKLPSDAVIKQEKSKFLFTRSFWINLGIMLSGWAILLIVSSYGISLLSGIPVGLCMGFGLKRQYGLNWFQMVIISIVFILPFFLKSVIDLNLV